ncbi:MAG: hypothetical protein H7833_06770 [Magnetococcus sp. DMHC-1]
MNPHRRHLLVGMGAAATLALFGGVKECGATPWLWNPCHDRLPPALANHPLVTTAWKDIDPQQVWDGHAHIAGIGDSDSGIHLSAEMYSLWHPVAFVQRLFYLNAGCADHASTGQVDQRYIERLRFLLEGMRPGVKLLLFAFDRAHTEAGQPLPEHSTLHVPNAYARSLALAYPTLFEWVASIHPYRLDAVAALEQAHAEGARAIKWLPPAMGIDPASARCQLFYQTLARFNMPLITHGGEEKAVHGVGKPEFGNPLRLRRALDAGVRTIVAHCASIGEDHDDDNGNRRVASFTLFTRMMDNPAYRSHLFGDISAITLRNRSTEIVRTLVEREEWHGRLLNGTDYPLPGIIPLIRPASFARAGLLAEDAVPVLHELQTYNPLLFDFVLKRHLVAQGRRLPSRIFETRGFFERGSL